MLLHWFIIFVIIGLSFSALAQFSLYEEKARLYKQVFGIEMPKPIFREISVEVYIDGEFDQKENIEWDSTNNQVLLPKSLLLLIEPYLKAGTKVNPEWAKDDLLNIYRMRVRGFDINFNKELFRLEIKTPPDIRRRLTISYLPQTARDIDYTSDSLSGYLNLYSTNNYDVSVKDRYSGSQLFESSVSLDNMTWQYEGEYEDSGLQSWYNRGARFIIADESLGSHIIFGDQTPQNVEWSLAPPPLAKSINSSLVGVGINKRISMGDSSLAYGSDFYYDFSVSTNSEIMVYVNGKITYQVNLPAGRYRLKDLPLEAGFNKIRIDTVGLDGTYNRVEDNYYQRYDMLKTGQWEYDIAVGMPYIKKDNLSELDKDNEIGIAYIRYGMNDKLTLGSYLQYQEKLKIFGFIQQWGTSVGYLTLDLASSRDELGNNGWGKQFEWSSDATYSPIGAYDATYTGYGLRTNYFSKKFKNKYQSTEDFSSWQAANVRTVVAPFLSFGFPSNTQLSLIAGYVDFHNPDIDSALAWGSRLEQNIGDVNIWAAYSNVDYDGDRQQYWALNFEWRPSNSSHSFKSHYDSYLDSNRLTYEYVDPTNSFNRYNIENTYKDNNNKSVQLSSEYRKGYDHEKYQIKKTVRDGIEEKQLQWVYGSSRGKSRFNTSYIDSENNNSTLYVESGVAFAGNQWGITRPIKDSFTIFYANPGFEGNVEFGDGAKIDRFGSAVVSDTSSYEINEYKVKSKDLSSLASISDSSFEVKNRYASGTAIGIGSAANMFLRGLLVNQNDEPISLKAGRLIPLSANIGEIIFFTDGDGKIAVKGISVGKWRLMLLGQTDEVIIDVFSSKNSIVEIGTIVVKINE